MNAKAKLRWGIIGTGLIAKEFADGVRDSTTGVLLAVGSRQQETAEKFGDAYGIARRYGSYEALLADPEVEAVYISTPHPMHAEWAIKAAEAGKHILVEKPLGLNYAEAVAMIDAAQERDVFLMEAFMYRCHPQIKKLAELIRAGAIGEIQLIRASFAYRAQFDPASRFFNNDLGGGGILDVGCYPVSLARLIAGVARGKPFAEPIEVKGCGHLGQTGVDEYAAAVLRFPGDIIAEVSAGVGINMHDVQIAEIFGTDGKITLPNPWIPSRWDRQPVPIFLKRHADNAVQTILVEAPLDLYTYEADEVARHIERRQAPAMPWDDSLGNMRTLDRWRQEIGLVYDQEKPENYRHTIARRPLRVRAQHNMRYGRIPGLEKPIARLIMGADSNNTMPDTAMLFDDYFARGGNAFDTSYGYGMPNGACERNLGWWIRQRGIRDQVVVIEKGANFPNDHPEGLTKELIGGLERLQMDYVDIYMIHRDNERIPIGEWVDVLNENLRAGRMKVFGLSNFSIERLAAFQAYAAKRGLQSFAAVSNQFSLAQVLAPIWNMHLVSSTDPLSRQWFAQTQTPLFAWSSQARGFFTDRAGRDKRDDPEMVRCWYSEDNFKRKERAEELARRRGVSAINIALAWVLNQPFPTFALIGAKRPSETRSCLAALDIALSAEEVRWLWEG
ncbi:MAG: aldo/keto reductase [Planctomycetota bacterium]|nr:aldo/keto reductase [Planctomycetota bacterium]